MIIIEDQDLYTVNLVIDNESSGIYVFVGDGINEIGARISLNPEYVKWLNSNRKNIKNLFNLSTIQKDKHAWFISEGHYDTFKYRNELVNSIEKLKSVLSGMESSDNVIK